MDRSLSRRFGLLFALHRMRAGLSQEECGRVVGLHRTELSLLERGARTPRLDTLLQLAAAIETPPSELVTGMSWSPGVVETGGEYVLDLATAMDDA